MRTIEAGIVIIGGGPAGLSAAWEAGSRGIRTLVLEKTGRPGGVSGGGIGMFAVESSIQKKMLIKFSVEDAFRLVTDYTHNKADARLLSEYLRRSAGTVEWFIGMGAEFTGAVAYYEGAKYTWHMYSFRNELRLPERIIKSMTDGGFPVEILTGAAAKRIVKDGSGRVCGVEFTRGGETVLAKAGAVIVATGGFGGNKEWVKELSGLTLGEDLFTMDVSRAQGEGLRLAWEAGAAKSRMDVDIYCGLGGPYGGPGGVLEHYQSFRQPNLMVNLAGERFMDEGQMMIGSYAANAVLQQKNHCGFMIFDSDTEAYYAENGWDLIMNDLPTHPQDTDALVRRAMAEHPGWLFAAGSLGELADMMGVDREALLATAAEYNGFCDAGHDPVLFKERRFLRPVRGKRFYGAKFCLNGYGTLGGIKIDWRTRVLDDEFRPIPGLYAAGNDVNTLFGDSYPFMLSGNTSGFAYNTGRMAGENAALLFPKDRTFSDKKK